MIRDGRHIGGVRLWPILLWVLLLLLAGGALAAYQRLTLVSELGQESTILHRLVSQRADQHDAHMTALSAIAVAGEGRRADLFLDVAATITRFYPRIDNVQLVPLAERQATIGIGSLPPAVAEEIRNAARSSDGRIVLLARTERPNHYMMVKRSPNTDAALYGLALGIDAGRLIGEAGPFWSRPSVSLRLSLPGGESLYGPAVLPSSARFSKPLGSASQPLLLETGMEIGFADLFPPLRTALVAAAVSLLYLAALAVFRQRARTRAAMRQARLSTVEARLAHASRVNALGEMASGLAHELTQPLTAILAQAQAGRRLLGRGDAAALEAVLEDTVTQARRASGILERFRDWSRPQRAAPSAFDLREAIGNVEALMAQATKPGGVRLELDMPRTPVLVVADPVEMEQVVFNLVRNAVEALEGADGPGRVTVALALDGTRAVLEVADNGPGVRDDLRRRLFTPFTTTRTGGTGLGLALSQRLVERAGGEISLVDGGSGAKFRVVLPSADAMKEAAQ
ncbi:sensor histidine kinase [Nitratireductor sp. ZSWI3]|uniref:sensor histidine kinase n=1 Tax=Nitratireductor sp. ZSWI3 TaxID=2966359 RepID=UPI00215063CE|nr:ATP-binding protein [Nitratireductor sp. ZSWI3]MCR4266814.1 ATP-binding protein [Nitratireductor sp. ZSWI3]